MKKLSVIILTHNEQEFLPGCLESVKWANEIIVVDADSQDRTRTLAEKFGARVVNSPWKGFPKQRNRGAQEAIGDWLLYVDADERVSKELREEIRELLKKEEPEHQSYRIPHRNIILGKWLRYGGWYPEYQLRLIKKSKLKGWEGRLHEHPEVEGRVGTINGDLIHLTHRGMHWMLTKTIRYTRMEAKLRHMANHPKVTAKHLFSAPAREFWYRCVKTSGWRDGLIGWIEILYQSFNQFLIMAWLWEMQQRKTQAEVYADLDREIADEL